MAQGPEIPLEQARAVARRVTDTIAPHCSRVEIAGSIRRGRPVVHDVDLVVIPIDHSKTRLAADFLALHRGERTWSVNGGKVWKFVIEGVPIDVYFATAETWALKLLVRTGSAKHNQLLAVRAQKLRMKFRADGAGIERRDGSLIPIHQEADVFEALQLPYREPAAREVPR
jgi:DNA polymerase (family 10)